MNITSMLLQVSDFSPVAAPENPPEWLTLALALALGLAALGILKLTERWWEQRQRARDLEAYRDAAQGMLNQAAADNREMLGLLEKSFEQIEDLRKQPAPHLLTDRERTDISGLTAQIDACLHRHEKDRVENALADKTETAGAA